MAISFRAVLGIGRNGSHLAGAPPLTFYALPTQHQSCRTMVIKENLKLPDNYPKPWPYRERGFDYAIHTVFDKTKPHFHENSKLIIVEGNVGAQKSQTAREIADAFGLLYIPEFKMEDILIDRYGNDLRDYYHYLPDSFRIPDVKMFYENPYVDQSALMQWRYFQSRFDQYLNALAHIFNTGQGVVLERSVYSDCVFVNAMRSKNFIGPEFFKYYYYTRKLVPKQAHFWPHLIVYLDAPVNVCLENIKKRGDPNEIEHCDEKYLKVIEETYKDVLKEYKRYSRILTYDWTSPGHSDTVVEDILKLELDFFEWHSGDIFYHWHQIIDETNFSGYRDWLTSKYGLTINVFGSHPHLLANVGELYQHFEDVNHAENVIKNLVLKSGKNHGMIRERGDPIKGIWTYRREICMPEPWYEYYYRERWYAGLSTFASHIDPEGKNSFDPFYTHH